MDSVPPPPPDGDQKNIIDKLAQFVARNGPEFENMTKNKQKGNPKFQFLFGGEYYHYYMYKVNTEQAIIRQQQQQQWGGQGPQGYPGQGPQGYPGQGPQAHQNSWGPRNNANSYGYNNTNQDQQWGRNSSMPPTPMPPQISYPPPQQGVGNNAGLKPKPLMELQSNLPSGDNMNISSVMPPNLNVPPPNIDVKALKTSIEGLKSQQKTLQEQITQSESNLAAQQTVTMEQARLQSNEAIRKAKWEHLELLASDTGIDLEEMETVLQPIIENCTKESISGGKIWIFSKATSHDNNRLIAHYLAYRVTQEAESFILKLHLIYLMNDVLHHCVRKYAEELKQSLESVAVEMFSAAWTSSANDNINPPTERDSVEIRQGKLSKLINLWEDKAIFSPSTLNKMRSSDDSWKAYVQQLKLDYADLINSATSETVTTYDQYASQHQAFVSHAQSSISNMEQQIKEMEKQLRPTDLENTTGNRNSSWEQVTTGKANDPPPPGLDSSSSASANAPNQERTKKRSSRWDTGQTEPKKPFSYGGGPPIPAFNHMIQSGAQRNFDFMQNQPPPPIPQVSQQGMMPPFAGPPPSLNTAGALPDLSKPPPIFGPGGSIVSSGAQPPLGVSQSVPTQWGPPPQSGQQTSSQQPATPVFDENALIPSLPYYDLPAGLMIPLVKMEDSGYKPLNPKNIRLPPPTPPTERLIAALEQFYAPPSHERPRDPEGFEMLGLYEWSKEKSNAIKAKADDLEMGRRDRSPTESPDPYGPSEDSRESTPDREYGKEFDRFENKMAADREEMKANRRAVTPPKRKRYRSETPERVREKKRQDRSRSRTRSRSRGSTPERSGRRSGARRNRGSFSRSPSPPGGYSMPSYLTRRSPSPGNRISNRKSRSPSPSRRNRRRSRSVSPEGPSYAGFGSTPTSAPVSRLDSTNKGHQMLMKMGYSGSGGLGKSEGGIEEPISGGEVRDKNDMYKGVGVGGPDAFEMFRKNKAGTFYKDQRERRKDRKKNDR